MSDRRDRFDIQSLAHAKPLSLQPRGTEIVFTRFLGVDGDHSEVRAACLRCYEDPRQWRPRMNEAPDIRLDRAALRTSSLDALERSTR